MAIDRSLCPRNSKEIFKLSDFSTYFEMTRKLQGTYKEGTRKLLHMFCTSNHMFQREIGDKFTEFPFLKFYERTCNPWLITSDKLSKSTQG